MRQFFEEFLQSRHIEETETITRDEFCDIEFTYGGLPVLYRDILYNLIGYVFGVPDLTAQETLNFYNHLIKDSAAYTQWHEKRKYFLRIEE